MICKQQILLAISLIPAFVYPHRPSYSVFPQTTFAGGRSATGELFGFHNEGQVYLFPAWDFIYGFEHHENLNLEFYIPAFIRDERDCSESNKTRLSGLGEIYIYFKYRFYKKGDDDNNHQIALVTGLRLPTSTQREDTNIGSSSPGFVAYLTYGHEALHWYVYGFGGMILSFPTDHLFDGHQFYISLASFYRPKTPIEHHPDWAFGVEISAVFNLKDKCHNIVDPNSGYSVLYIGPSFGRVNDNGFWSGGIQWAVAQHINGIQPRLLSRFIFSYSVDY